MTSSDNNMPGEVALLREALEASEYLASLYERLWKGGRVCDLTEAIAYAKQTRAALTQQESRNAE